MTNQNKLQVGMMYRPTVYDLVIVLSDNSKLLINLFRRNLCNIPPIEVRYH